MAYKYFRVIFKKHFDVDGLGDDYPTDFLHVRDGVLDDMTFIEMRGQAKSAERDEDGGATGEEEWQYSVVPGCSSVFERALDACETVISYTEVDAEVVEDAVHPDREERPVPFDSQVSLEVD
jgi:hypothetical protein